MNPHHPFPNAETQQFAEQFATRVIDRYVEAKRAMHQAADGGTNADAVNALRALADATRDMHRLIAIGWHFDNPF